MLTIQMEAGDCVQIGEDIFIYLRDRVRRDGTLKYRARKASLSFDAPKDVIIRRIKRNESKHS